MSFSVSHTDKFNKQTNEKQTNKQTNDKAFLTQANITFGASYPASLLSIYSTCRTQETANAYSP